MTPWKGKCHLWFWDPENPEPFWSKQFMKTQNPTMNQEVAEFKTYLFHFLNAHLCSWHYFFVSQVWPSRLQLLFFYVVAKDSQVSRFPPILLLNHRSQCLWQRNNWRVHQISGGLKGWFSPFRYVPSLILTGCSIPYLCLFFFLSLLKSHFNSELFGFYKEKMKRCWSSTWEVVGKEGVLSENGVQPSEQLFRTCPCSSDPISKWAIQFAFMPWIASFFFFPKEVFNLKKSGFNIHIFGLYLLNLSNALFKVLWWTVICLFVFKVTYLVYSPNSCNLGHLVISNSAWKAGILVGIKWTEKKKISILTKVWIFKSDKTGQDRCCH